MDLEAFALEVNRSLALDYSSFSSENDGFTPASFALRSFYLDRIADGRPITSGCPIFKLPFELLPDILCLLNWQDLANLALVDRDCLRLARPTQFSTIHLSVGCPAVEMLTQIFSECTGNGNEGIIGARGLGIYVQRLIVRPSASDLDYDATVGNELSRKELESQDLLTLLSVCLPVAFPNLKVFQLADGAPIPLALLRSLASIPLQHLSFDAFLIESKKFGRKEEAAIFSSCAWPGLQSLSITLPSNAHWSRAVVEANDRAISSILNTVAPSLEGLRLIGVHRLSSLPEFPRLRRLHLERCSRGPDDGSELLRRLLPLDGIAINFLEALQVDRIDDEHILRIRRMPQLRRLVVNDISLRIRDANFVFLAANPRLELLSFTFPVNAGNLRDKLLPSIHASGFSCLRALRLTSASHFSKRAIFAIGLISSLEMVWLSAGRQIGWKYDWFVDHNTIQRGLKGLKKLREIAFTRENYNNSDNFILDFCSNASLPPGVSEHDVAFLETETENSSGRCMYIREKWHRAKMRKLAGEYADLFPHLSFVYAGEYPMEVVRDWGSKTRRIDLLTEQRDTYLTMLSRKWGGRTI